MYVRDLVGNEYVCQATTTHNLSLNGEQSLSFTLEYTKPNAVFIDNITEMWEVVDDNDVEHKIVLVSKKAQGERPFVEVRAVPLFFDSFDSLRIYDEYNEHMTATRAFSLIFEDTPFNYILVGNFAAVEWEGFGAGEPRLETFKRALERYKAEFRIVGNTVYIEELIGRDTQFMYRHRLNASNIVVETDATGYWTYAKGYGDFGNEGTGDGESSDWKDAKLTVEYTSPLASIPGIGIRHGPPIKDGRITDKSTMQNSLKALVDGSLKISISADIHDLRRQGYALGQPELGDRVFVIDERIGLHEEVRVSNIDITKDWRGNVLDLNLTIGSPSVVKRHQANISTAIKQITEIVEGVRKIPYNVLDNAIIEATKALQNAQTELKFTTNGILAIDKNDPNMVTLMNSAGLGVSRDGGATFRNAITGFGINADVITAGAIRGIVIEQESNNRRLVMYDGVIDSYYNSDLAMRFGQYSLDFYNRSTERIGRIIPLQFSSDPNEKGLGIIVDEDFINIGYQRGSSYHAILRSSQSRNLTTITGPYNNLNDGSMLRLFANRRQVSDGRFSTHDQPAIILDQSEDSNDLDIFFGGFNRRSNAVFRVRHNNTSTTNSTRLEVGANGTHISGNVTGSSSSTGNMLGSGGQPYYEVGTGSATMTRAGALTAGGIAATSTGTSHFYIGSRDGSEVRITSANGYNDGEPVYRSIRAANFIEASSIKYKSHFEEVDKKGLDVINNLEFVKYRINDDLEHGIYNDEQVGVIAELSPDIAFREGEGINTYKFTSYLGLSIQELDAEREKTASDIEALYDVITVLIDDNKRYSERIRSLESKLI